MATPAKLKETVCRFCGTTCLWNKATRRLYDTDGEFHVTRCPKRARHFHEKALDTTEELRQRRFAEYNRRGTETTVGCIMDLVFCMRVV